MGAIKTILKPGNGKDKPKVGDKVTIEYTGYLYDEPKSDNHYLGKRFDTSKGRGPLVTEIVTGQVIKGWDERVVDMSLGEKAILTISADYGYGPRGFPGLIPPNSDLVFEVELLKISGKSA